MDKGLEYGKNYFWSRKGEKGEKRYFFKINNLFVEVDQEIYKLCMNSAKKIEYAEMIAKRRNYRSMDNEYDDIEWEYLKKQREDILDDLIEKEIETVLYKAIRILDPIEKKIITGIYFNGLSERELSKLINLPQTTINYKKKKILKKLKMFLINDDYFNGLYERG